MAQEIYNAKPTVAEENPSSFVIVIGREFGSGGRTVGKLISSILGIDYYDTELLNKAAEKEGVNPQVFKEHEEKKPNLLKILLQGSYGIADNFHTVPLSSERIYRLQSKVIQDIAQKGSCVIVGRNADFILRDHKRLLSVFLHSPLEIRAKRIVERGEANNLDDACEIARQHDKRRESFYNFYTGDKKWGVASNYHLSLDTSFLDNETVAEIIIKTAKNKLGI
ncbi:MAG: cytidylate kinase-like family protein [Muribaculaceae bacterium]|nr:cytidylate kinase-like family protein [Muribaculaceae bacterium]